MLHVALFDHGGFWNRGCEAIVRSTMDLLTARLEGCRFTLWSNDAEEDRKALRGEAVRVCDLRRTAALEYEWPYRLFTGIGRRRWPGLPLAKAIVRAWPGVPHCALSVGGDNFTLDYGLPTQYVKTGQLMLALGVPYVIWGASIGPFHANADLERQMKDFLPRVDMITARESATVEYLATLGVAENVVRTWDPAFALEPEVYAGPEAEFTDSGDVLGLNLSALPLRWMPGGSVEAMLDEVAKFLGAILETGLRVLLIPHVTRPDGPLEQDDESLLRKLLGRFGTCGAVRLLPGTLPARQVKWVISQCRYFIGARTHSTIAALSTETPTITIAYSQKARGLFRDVFSHSRYVVESASFSAQALHQAWNSLLATESEARTILREQRPKMLAGAKSNAELLAGLLGR